MDHNHQSISYELSKFMLLKNIYMFPNFLSILTEKKNYNGKRMFQKITRSRFESKKLQRLFFIFGLKCSFYIYKPKV